MSNTTEILNATAIEHKIQRLAWELYDRHHNATDLHVVGIKDNVFYMMCLWEHIHCPALLDFVFFSE